MEEVRLSIEIIKSIGLFWFFRYDGDQIICTTFLCKARDHNIDITKNMGDNITQHRYVTKEEFLKNKYPVGHESLKQLLCLI